MSDSLQPEQPPRKPRRKPRRSAVVLPTMFTLGNALCGFMAIFMASRPADMPLPMGWSTLTFAAGFIFLGMVCDAVDGRIARLTHSTSDLGAQLDSMADMVSFGVAPAFVAVQLIQNAVGQKGVILPFLGAAQVDSYFNRITLIVALIYVACAALRLARFNVMTKSAAVEDHLSFTGLPSPGAAGTVASMVLLHEHFLRHPLGPATQPAGGADLSATISLASQIAAAGMVAIMALVAFAMVSRLKYVHVINRYVQNRARFSLLAKVVVVGLLLMVAPQWSLAAGFVLYALSAPVLRLLKGKPKKAGAAPA